MGSVTVTTSEQGVAEIHAELKGLGKRTLGRISRQMGEEGVSLIQLGFSSGTDPYGATWRPLKYRQGQPLRKTGALQGSAKLIYSDETMFSVAVVDWKAPFHQFGTKRGIPQRKMVPDVDLPAFWAASFAEVYEEFMSSVLS